MVEVLTSIHGRKLGLAKTGNLVANSKAISQPCVDAAITVGAENTNVRAIAIQLKDANGNDINYAEIVTIYVFADATMQALATTGGSTGIAIGTDGTILNTVLAKKIFTVVSEADGDIDLTWTDTATESVVLGIRMPSGRIVLSSPFANA
jgi:hypothetical protein